MGFLITAGVISLIFGMISLLSREILLVLGSALNKPILYFDDKLKVIRVPIGLLLTGLGVWIISVAFNYPELWYLHLIGILILFFGLLYLFIPEWITVLSRFLDQVMLTTDELFIGTRKALGVIMILAAIYIFYSAYLMAV